LHELLDGISKSLSSNSIIAYVCISDNLDPGNSYTVVIQLPEYRSAKR